MSTPQMAAPAANADTAPILDWDDVVYDANGKIEKIHDPASNQTFSNDDDETKPAASAPSEPQPSGQPPVKETVAASSPETSGTAETAKSTGELLLRHYGLEDTKIMYGDEEVDFKDLDPEAQFDVLLQLAQQGQEGKTAETPAISPEAQRFDELLKQGMSPQDIAKQMIGEAAQMSVDDLNIRDIKEQYPMLSEEEVQIELEERKSSKLYDRKSEALRSKYQAEAPSLDQMSTEQKAAEQAVVLQERQQITQTAQELSEIDGFTLDDQMKNTLLADLVESEENGFSPFVNRMEDPKTQLRLAFWDKYAPAILDHFNKELSVAEERGYQKALGTFPASPTIADGGTTSRTNTATNNSGAPAASGGEDAMMKVTTLGGDE